MRIPAFVWGSYEAQARTADASRTVNWYPEVIPDPGAPVTAALLPTPGVETIATAASNPGRAHFFENSREFMVIGDTFYEMDTFGNLTVRGSVAVDTNPATISSNGDGGGQLFVTSGGNGYVYDLSLNTLTQITALNGRATFGDVLDGYFLCLDASTSTLFISALLDGSSWNTGIDFAQRSIASDPWISMKVLGRYIWLFGEQTSEVWYNVGTSFPFAPHPSGLVRYGILAPFSVAIADDKIYWLAATRFGDGFVMSARGFTPQIISTDALQLAINNYANPRDAQGYTYSDLGHTFYVLNFITADITWAYDDKVPGVWCERGTWIPSLTQFEAWRPRWHARAFGEHRVLDANSGAVYRMSSNLGSDVDGRLIRRVRRAPGIQTELERLFYTSFELNLETGLGTATGQGSDPQVGLRYSNDGGKTWGPEALRSAGKIGEYLTRVRWNRLGNARRRVFEVSVTDPIPWRLMEAYYVLRQRPRTGMARQAS